MTRLLVAGGGLIGSRHIEHILEHPDMVLAGVIDPDPAVRGKWQVPGFADMTQVDVQADGIILATPSDLHLEHAEMAAARRWHMLIEKPVASTLEQADRIIAATALAGVKTLVGHHRRHHPKVKKLKALVEQGVIGQPITASLIWALKKPAPYFDVPWRRGRDGSPVLINLVHDVDVLRYVFGEVVHVSGFGSNRQRGQGRIESGSVTLGFASGMAASIAFADTTPSPWAFEAGTGENPNIAFTGQDMLRIAGSAGAIGFPSLTVWTGAADWSQTPQSGQIPCEAGVPLVNQLEHFADVIAGRAESLIDAQDGWRSLEVTLRIEDVLMQGLT